MAPVIELDARIPVQREIIFIVDEALRNCVLSLRQESRKLKRLANDQDRRMPPAELKALTLATETLVRFKRVELAARRQADEEAQQLSPREVMAWVIEKARQMGVSPDQLPTAPIHPGQRYVPIADLNDDDDGSNV